MTKSDTAVMLHIYKGSASVAAILLQASRLNMSRAGTSGTLPMHNKCLREWYESTKRQQEDPTDMTRLRHSDCDTGCRKAIPGDECCERSAMPNRYTANDAEEAVIRRYSL